jgi:tripartite-type tricarboxylate transporter receptor subunit TctC
MGGTAVKPARRQFLSLAGAAVAATAIPRIAVAQPYPLRPVRVIVPFAPAGSTDLIARLIGQWLAERLGQPFIIDNRPGAGTNIGTEAVVRAPADGYTLLVATPPSAINATLYEKLSFVFLRDIAPVAGVLRSPIVMEITPSLAAKTVPEFIAYAKANSGKISMASAGIGSGPHMAGELFKMMAGVNMVDVPYRGSGPALIDLIGGQVQIYFDALPTSMEHIKAGKLRALAVTTAARADVLPDTPALSEFLPGYEASFYGGFCAPKNTPSEIVDKLNKEINAALTDPKVRARLAELGGTPLAGTPASFGKLIAEETEKWGKVIKFAGIKPE